jgi:polyketide cyclase/dehydrase/lipid transport protein
MATFELSESAVIPAPPDRVYRIIADYANEHPHIVSQKVFRNLRVEAGGYGAGTRIRFEMYLLGRTFRLRAAVTEPEPGRVLVETDLDRDTVTTFTVDPEASRSARVTIHTRMTVRGLAGFIQRWLVPRLLRPLYREELQKLAARATAS